MENGPKGCLGVAIDTAGTNNGTYSGDAHIVREYFRFGAEENNCLWWSVRAEDGILSVSNSVVDEDREKLRQKGRRKWLNICFKKTSKPYKFTGDNSRILNIGSNRKANKNKALYKPVIASGKEIQISIDIYEFKQCNDVIDPQEEKIASQNQHNRNRWISRCRCRYDTAILPVQFIGRKRFYTVKANLQITNNHDDDIGILQSPYLRELVGGMPHRRVKFGTPDADRPEAYILSASSTTLTLKQYTGPKSYTTRGSGIASGYSIRNVKTNTTSTPVLLGIIHTTMM